MSAFEDKDILVVVKTYPNPSRTHTETVCCAGVDLRTGECVRMYPITFRRLAGRQFAKFQRIRCRATRPPSDTRPESWKIDQDSIELVGQPMAAGETGWLKRMAVLPEPSQSFDEIEAAQARERTSLGMFRPKEILSFEMEPAEPWSENQKAYLRQQHLDLGQQQSRELNELEQIPFKFRYRFTCDDPACQGPHRLTIIDWEIGAAYRRWKREYGPRWEEKLRETWERELPERDLHFVVGNVAAHPQVFMVVGVVRPPRPKVDRGGIQKRLDLGRQERPVARVGVGLKAQEAGLATGDERQDSIDLFGDET